MSKEILMLMYKRDNLHKKAVRTGDPELYTAYKRCRNQVVKLIRQAKKDFYTNEIDQSKSSKQMWKTIRNLIKSKPESTSGSPDNFNDFFTNIGPQLNSTFPDSSDLHWTQPESIHTFTLSDVKEDGVFNELSALSSSTNTDLLGFDTRLLKEGAEVLTSSLTSLFNKSLTSGIIPADFKRARVTPIYKGKGELDDYGNYRPISVVPHIAKILEKCVQSQLMTYLDSHSLISVNQSAFLKGHSTVTATHKVFEDVLDDINDGFINAMCLIDLTKCFDTIDHNLLTKKLERYGIKGSELRWFSNYLSDRTQAVQINNVMSDFKPLLTGVPQGSVLGPILFLIFINDLPSCLRHSSCSLYADDTVIHVSGKTVSEAQALLQKDINNLVLWFKANKLIINAKKSFSMLFSCSPVNNELLTLTIDDIPVECVSSTKYLGLYADSNFKWDVHISNLCKTISPKIGLLRKLKQLLPQRSVELVYKSTIQSRIDYCISTWGYSDKKYIKQVQGLQNRAARIITGNYDRDVSSIDLVKSLGWPTVEGRRDYFTSLLVFKALHGVGPTYMQDMFTLTSNASTIVTRAASNGNLYVPRLYKSIFGKSLTYNGPRIWNKLPLHFRNAPDIDSFKTLAKRHFS